MSIAITEEHQALAETVTDFLAKNDSRGAARDLLESPGVARPDFWDELCALGWAGIHLPEDYGGSGYGMPELVIIAEGLGYGLAPGPFAPTVVAAAVIAVAGSDELKAAYLPGLADGSLIGSIALDGDVAVDGGSLEGSAVALSAGGADILLVAVGDDVAVVRCSDSGVAIETPKNLDPSRPADRVAFDGADAEIIAGARSSAEALARTVLAAEAVGVARYCTESASEYAKERQQFGRPIATFQAVKHHCANMLVATEMATAAVWDAARAGGAGGDPFAVAAATAATLAGLAGEKCAQLNIQVHGGIGFTWEHDAHLYLRRATALQTLLDLESSASDVTDLTRGGVRIERSVDLPPEAEVVRGEVSAFVDEVNGLEGAARKDRLVESGYAVPHWPEPWGRAAGAVEQLVIEQEFDTAGISRPAYGITAWVILTLIQHATDDQVERFVPDALRQEVIWCQLFSEPDAGSDAAGVKTRGTRVDGGWLVNGQKVWTSGAHKARWGLATIRTNPDAPKHNGITTMVIDMEADEVEVRPLRMPTGQSEFNEVFFNDVFVPDDDVIGPIDGGWTVARATLGNESVSIGGGASMMTLPVEMLIAPFDAHPERLAGGAARLGRYIASEEAMKALNLRSAHRAVAGGGPGPEGNVTKLVLSENGHELAAIMAELTGPDTLFTDGGSEMTAMFVLLHRAMSIAGGTSEIKRNQIGERILGLPRDPLIK